MARPLRLEFANALYHVTARGNDQRQIFHDDIDRTRFLGFLAIAVRRFRWSVTAYVLMSNHFHLVVRTPEPTLSRGMHWLNGRYAASFNRRHKRTGHLFQGRFHSVLVDEGSYFVQVLRYVVLNPVRAGMCALPEEYRWSSYRETARLDLSPEWLDVRSVMHCFGRDQHAARSEYRRFVMEKVVQSDELWTQLRHGQYLGGDEWAIRIRRLVESRPRSTDHPKTQRAVGRPGMQRILDVVHSVTRVEREALRTRSSGTLRRLVAWLGWNEGLVTLRSIAAALRLRSEGYVSSMIRRCEIDFSREPLLLHRLDLAVAALRA